MQKPSAKSLLSTCFGDLGVPHGGRIWVETLTELLAPLGISSRLVRTSLFRLVEEDWLQATRAGRRSYYQLTTEAKRQTRLAESLIYHRDPDSWDGHWTVIMLNAKPTHSGALLQLERELAWLGFGALAKHVFIHPTAAVTRVAECIGSLGLSQQVVCFSATNLAATTKGLEVNDPQLALSCFNTDVIASRYTDFVDRFSPLSSAEWTQSLSSIGDSRIALTMAPSELLALRILIVDAYRRIVLHDPHLPDELLPQPWIGHEAYALCRQIYRQLRPLTDQLFSDGLRQAGSNWRVAGATEYDDRFAA